MRRLRVLIVFGTRPEAIKLAPVVRACRRRARRIEARVCFSGQHKTLARDAVEYLGLSPDVALAPAPAGRSLAEAAAHALSGLDAEVARWRPDAVVSQGDTTTAAAAALSAFYRRTAAVHVEAGLRTGDLDAPWPEELHRRLIALAARLHCAPTPRAAQALLAEGVPKDAVHVTGNPVVDSLRWTLDRERRRDAYWRARRPEWRRRVVLVTAHRRENLGAPLRGVCRALRRLARRFPDATLVVAAHPNPEAVRDMACLAGGPANLRVEPPLAYPELVWLLRRAALVLTDSGGIQEEACVLGTPTLVLRATTERPEALAAGTARLVGTDEEAIFAAGCEALGRAPRRRPALAASPLGDGRAGQRIAELMLRELAPGGGAATQRPRATSAGRAARRAA